MAYVGNPGSNKIITTDSTGKLAPGAVGSGLSLAAGTLTGGWQTTYEVDFTTLTPVASYSNGTATIDGKTWTFAGLGANNSASLSSNGLQLVTNAGGGASSASAFQVLLSSFGAVPGQDQVLVWGRVQATLSTTFNGSGNNNIDFAIATDVNLAYALWLRYWRTNSAGSGDIVNENNFIPLGLLTSTVYPSGSTIYAGRTTSNSSHDVWVLKYVTANLMEIYTGSWSSGWPAFSSLQMRGYIMINAAAAFPGGSGSNVSSPIPNPNLLNFVMRCERNSTTTTDTVSKLLNLRVQVK